MDDERRWRPLLTSVVDSNGLCVGEFTGAAVEVLKDHLGVWVGHKSFAAKLLGHVEDVIDLNHTEVRVQTL